MQNSVREVQKTEREREREREREVQKREGKRCNRDRALTKALGDSLTVRQ